MSHIFISYNRQSKDIAKTLVVDLGKLGHTVWFDQELSGGQSWWDTILSTVRDCDVFVFILDSKALDSVACKREYGYAADLGKPILPILVTEGVSTNLLPPELSRIQIVDYRKRNLEAAFSLSKALANVPPSEHLPDPLPAPPEVPISYLGALNKQITTASTLNYAEQSALLIDCKKSLEDPEITDDARTLLERLKKRQDLFAKIDKEIDELLGRTRKTSSAHPRAPEAEFPSKEQSCIAEISTSEEDPASIDELKDDTTTLDQRRYYNRLVKMVWVSVLAMCLSGLIYVGYKHSPDDNKKGTPVEQQENG